MRIEILGSGGSIITPKPMCDCPLCQKARSTGGKSVRLGPCVYIHDAGILFDTPEETAFMLARSGVMELNACFYSHWHPDHTAGRRVFEANIDFPASVEQVAALRTTDVYIPDFVRPDMERYLTIWENLSLFDQWGLIRLHTMDEPVMVNEVRIRCVRQGERRVSAFIAEGQGKRALIVMDEVKGWVPEISERFDVVLMPIGCFPNHPVTGEDMGYQNNLMMRSRATFSQCEQILSKLSYDSVVFGHVPEDGGLDHETLSEWVKLLSGGRDWSVGYDGMMIQI